MFTKMVESESDDGLADDGLADDGLAGKHLNMVVSVLEIIINYKLRFSK